MSDLKPCPYCGDIYIRPHITKGGNYTIGCNTVNCIGLHCEGKLFKTEADAIEAWNRRTEPQWIPCSDRLPEELGNYLVSIKRIGWNCEEYVENDIAYWDDLFHKADKVIAWMPLPEPWRVEGEPK